MNFQEQRWGPAWITYMILKLFAGVKDTWESFACSLGVIDKSKKDHYSRIQRKKDLAAAHSLNDAFSQFDWSQPEDVPK